MPDRAAMRPRITRYDHDLEQRQCTRALLRAAALGPLLASMLWIRVFLLFPFQERLLRNEVLICIVASGLRSDEADSRRTIRICHSGSIMLVRRRCARPPCVVLALGDVLPSLRAVRSLSSMRHVGKASRKLARALELARRCSRPRGSRRARPRYLASTESLVFLDKLSSAVSAARGAEQRSQPSWRSGRIANHPDNRRQPELQLERGHRS